MITKTAELLLEKLAVAKWREMQSALQNTKSLEPLRKSEQEELAGLDKRYRNIIKNSNGVLLSEGTEDQRNEYENLNYRGAGPFSRPDAETYALAQQYGGLHKVPKDLRKFEVFLPDENSAGAAMRRLHSKLFNIDMKSYYERAKVPQENMPYEMSDSANHEADEVREMYLSTRPPDGYFVREIVSKATGRPTGALKEVGKHNSHRVLVHEAQRISRAAHPERFSRTLDMRVDKYKELPTIASRAGLSTDVKHTAYTNADYRKMRRAKPDEYIDLFGTGTPVGIYMLPDKEEVE